MKKVEKTAEAASSTAPRDEGDEKVQGSTPDTPEARMGSIAEQLGADHRKRVDAVVLQLLAEAPGAPSAQRLLLRLAGHDAVMAETTGNGQLLLAERAMATTDPKKALAFAKVLREMTLMRNSVTRRAQELLQAVSALRVQETLASNWKVPSR